MGGPTAVPRVARGSGPPIGPGATVAPGRQLRRPFRHDGPMRLILVRHGQTSSNISRALDTAEPGPDLTDLGRAQAAALSRVLDGAPIGAIYASTLVRTQQTAAPLAAAHGLDVQVRAGLREVSAGELEMRSDADAMQLYLDTVFAWREGNLDLRMPGGESGAEVYARFDDIAAEAVGTGVGTAVLVSHGAVIRSWCAARVDNVSIDYVARANVQRRVEHDQVRAALRKARRGVVPDHGHPVGDVVGRRGGPG